MLISNSQEKITCEVKGKKWQLGMYICLFFALFCAVFARKNLLCFALFCAVFQKPAHFACILRSAKNSLFALFCSVLHKTEQNFAFCAVLLCFVQSRAFALFCSVLRRAEILRCFALFCAEQSFEIIK